MTLENLKTQDKFAYITGHIPPIVDSFTNEPQWQVSYIERYKKVVGKYPDVIKAQFFGHVQSVEVRVPPSSMSASRPTGRCWTCTTGTCTRSRSTSSLARPTSAAPTHFVP